MDLAETMKSVLSKNGGNGTGGTTANSAGAPLGAEGYVTEKLYMLLQLYLQNKGWSPSIELLQCFTELKESSMLPSAAYLQLFNNNLEPGPEDTINNTTSRMMASRVGLDTQGRLILRENGKIILPFEHFANAVMLKHMNGPHGLHLGIEGTVRAVVDSYTIGREQFGMEKEFIIEVVQNCPNPACRYYKNQLEMTQKTIQQHLSQQPTYIPAGGGGLVDSQAVERLLRGAGLPQDFQLPLTPHLAALASGMDLANVSSGLPLPDTKPSAVTPSTGGGHSSHSGHSSMPSQPSLSRSSQDKHQHHQIREALMQQQTRAMAQQALEKYGSSSSSALPSSSLELKQQQQAKHQQKQQQQMAAHFAEVAASDPKLTDFLRANFETIESLSGGISGSVPIVTPAASTATSTASSGPHSQERVVRAFAELARNLHRMRPCVRPAMCKPYGKQSEQLQKILMDTIQLVQSLRSYLPPPHIQVTSWKNDDKLRSGSVDDLTGEQRKITTGN